LNRLVLKAAKDEAFICGLLVRRERPVRFRVQRGTRDLEKMQKQQDCIALSVCAKVRGGVELVGGSGERFTECHQR
jgi:hypothetical protein